MKAHDRGSSSRIVAIGAMALVLAGLERASATPTDDAYKTCMGTAHAEPESVISACTKVIALGGDHPSWLAVAYHNRGAAHINKGQLDAAIADLNAAVRLGPDFALAFAHRSVAWRLKGDMARALADANEAVHLDPLDVTVRQTRGELFLMRDEPAEAIADFQALLRRNPDSVMGTTLLANAYRLANDNQRALALYTQAATKNPKNFVAFLGRGYAHLNVRDWDAAIADFNTAVILRPDLYQPYEGLGHAYAGKGELALAVDSWSKAILADPKSAEAYNARCWTRGRQGRNLDLALADCDKALAIAPNNGAIHDSRALILYKLGRYAEAIVEDDAAVAQPTDTAGEYFLRAAAKSRAGDPNGAANDLAAARKLDPNIETAYSSYGVTLGEGPAK